MISDWSLLSTTKSFNNATIAKTVMVQVAHQAFAIHKVAQKIGTFLYAL